MLEQGAMRTSNRSIDLRAGILCTLILANFLAQIPYFFHNHYQSQPVWVSARSFVIMGAVFAFFLVATLLLFKRHTAGYPLMLLYLSVEFLFYLWGVIASVIHGYGILFQLSNPDLLLRTVFAIGYMNLLVSGYFLFLLLRHRLYFRAA